MFSSSAQKICEAVVGAVACVSELFIQKAQHTLLWFQHPFVTQLLTRNLIIELLDMANNPELHSALTHSIDDSELEVSD